MASTPRPIDPTIAAIITEAERLQLHQVLQQRRAERITALKEYIGFEGEISDYFTQLADGVHNRMEESLWELRTLTKISCVTFPFSLR